MEYNLIACPERFADIAQAMGEETRGLTMMEKASKAIEAVRKLSDDVGIPKGLRQVGVTDETRIEKMAEDTLLSVDLPTNPRRYDKKTIADLYRLSL
jgi:alcohol dehydrogenase class IV